MRAKLRAYLEESLARPLSPTERLTCSAIVTADKEFARVLQLETDEEMDKLYAAFSKLSLSESSCQTSGPSRKSKRKH